MTDRPGFDLDGYLAATVESERERLERQLQAKELQLQTRTELHENTIDRLKQDLREVEHELGLRTRTSEERPRLEARRDELRSALEAEHRRFQDVLRDLEDEKLELQAELDELEETQTLTETLAS